jgi:Tfp pilus assembly protein PilZ
MDYVKYAVNYNKLNLQMGGIQVTQNISPAGVFIKANDNLAAGQIVILGIPSKKKKTKVKGKVVWSNLEGFGVKFLGSKKK